MQRGARGKDREGQEKGLKCPSLFHVCLAIAGTVGIISVVLLGINMYSSERERAASIVAMQVAEREDHYLYKILLVVPGLGFAKQRMKILENSLSIIFSSVPSFPYQNSSVKARPGRAPHISCLVFTYVQPSPRETEALRVAFPIVMNKCSFVHHGGYTYGNFVKMATPEIVREGNFTHVIMHLDDIKLLASYNTRAILHIMSRNNLSAVTPMGASHRCTYPPARFGRQIFFLEFFHTLFTSEAWSCFWNLMDPKINVNGWSYEALFIEHCQKEMVGFKMGIIQGMRMTHQTGDTSAANRISSASQADALMAKHPEISWAINCTAGKELI